MKKRYLVPGIFVALLIGGYFFIVNGGMRTLGFAYWGAKMWQGKRYLKSITHENHVKLQWVIEARALLEIDTLTTKCIGAVGKNSPLYLEKYKSLGIQRIDVCRDHVNFMWMGGMDHTGLYIKRKKDSSFSITAGYNDYESREIYPEVSEPRSSLSKNRR